MKIEQLIFLLRLFCGVGFFIIVAILIGLLIIPQKYYNKILRFFSSMSDGVLALSISFIAIIFFLVAALAYLLF